METFQPSQDGYQYLPGYDDFLTGKIKTLGWAVLEWCSTYLAHPDDGKREGLSWEFYPEQALFVLRFYALNDDGTWRYNRAILERPKKWGKSPLLAAICCAELLGPVRFSHWDSNGFPVGKTVLRPLVQIAAISVDQVDNTYSCIIPMLLEGEAAEVYGLTDQHVMLSKVVTDWGGVIQKVTASPSGRQGQRVTFAVCDETHLWIPSKQGPELFEAINNNAVGMNTRLIETTNAPVPGQGSVAEKSHDAVAQLLKANDRHIPILLDTRNVDILDIYDREEAMPALEYVYGDAAEPAGGHVSLDRIYEQIIDPATDEMSNRRFYFNQRLSGKSAWLRKDLWDACRDPKLKLFRNHSIALGFKGTKDSIALVACRLADYSIHVLGYWENPNDGNPWVVPYKKIDERVRKILQDRDVELAFFEPERWQPQVAQWHADYEVVEGLWWNTKTKVVKAVEQFETAVEEKSLSHNDERLDQHVYNAQIEEFPQGRSIRKEHKKSKRHIVLAQAAILAFTAARVAIEDGALNERDSRLYTW